MIKYNLNKTVYVRLNEIGTQIYSDIIRQINSQIPDKSCWLSTEPQRDENGFSKFQLWDLIHIYGEYIGLGQPTPFDDNCIYFINSIERKQ